MLVLTRKLMEKLFIGDDICVTVVRLEGGQVRLGIDAPREVAVVRAELLGDRAGARFRPAARPAERAPASAGPRDFRYSPRCEARETDSRRRGRSR
jgi:carbon storage regulator